MSQTICSLLDCDRPAFSRGMCARHAANKRNYGHAEPVRDWPLIARLLHTGWTVTDRGCWEWNGKRHEHGYAIINAPRIGLYDARVHRIMWEMHNGPIEDPGIVVRHRCDNPPCVNPHHMELGTPAENSEDMVDRRRSIAYATGRYDGVCVQGRHDVSKPGALKVIRQKGRKPYYTCVACDRDRKARHARMKRSVR